MKDFIEYITKAGFTDIKTGSSGLVNATFEDLVGNKTRYFGIVAVIPKMPMRNEMVTMPYIVKSDSFEEIK